MFHCKLVLGATAALVVLTNRPLWATPFTPGNILMVNTSSSGPRLFEYTPSGTQVQAISIPGGSPRSVTLDSNGNAQIYDGTFGARLTTYDPVAEAFTFTPLSDFNTINNLTYGGIAAYKNYVYLTNMNTAGSVAPAGVVRVNVDNYSVDRIDDGSNPINLNIGLDGKLYTLSRGSAFNGGGNLVRVYDPLTLQFDHSVLLPNEHRALAVDAAGTIYADGIRRYTPTGVLIDAHAVNGNTSVRLTYDGDVLAGNWAGVFSVTDTSFASVFHYNLNPHQPLYGGVAFVVAPVPEPASVGLLGLGGVMLFLCGWRRQKRNR